jgi:hypothetical protein
MDMFVDAFFLIEIVVHFVTGHYRTPRGCATLRLPNPPRTL